jgi:hypothetical protein
MKTVMGAGELKGLTSTATIRFPIMTLVYEALLFLYGVSAHGVQVARVLDNPVSTR